MTDCSSNFKAINITFAGKPTPRIGLGTASLGGDLYGPTEKEQALHVIEEAFKLGIRLINTAPFMEMDVQKNYVVK